MLVFTIAIPLILIGLGVMLTFGPFYAIFSGPFELLTGMKLPEVVGDVIQFLGDNFVSGLQSFLDGFANGAGM